MLLSYFHWHPPITFTPFFENPRENLSQLIWPALAVGYRYSAVATRMMRSTLLEVLQEDYIRTARAKGVFERLVVVRHALSNAMLPVVTVIGLEFAFLIGGLVVTEQVFNLNGIGKLFVQAVTRSDFTMVQALVLLVATFFIVVNFVIDLHVRVARSAHPLSVDERRSRNPRDHLQGAAAPPSGACVRLAAAARHRRACRSSC